VGYLYSVDEYDWDEFPVAIGQIGFIQDRHLVPFHPGGSALCGDNVAGNVAQMAAGLADEPHA
jgi:hypothetical protein